MGGVACVAWEPRSFLKRRGRVRFFQADFPFLFFRGPRGPNQMRGQQESSARTPP